LINGVKFTNNLSAPLKCFPSAWLSPVGVMVIYGVHLRHEVKYKNINNCFFTWNKNFTFAPSFKTSYL